MSATLDFLFPVPSTPKSSLSPSQFPGLSPQSTQTLQDVLRDNHIKWHIFFNEKRFHNHAAHRALASWALGAEPPVISSGYQKDIGYEKPIIKAPHPITHNNFNEHLGDDRFYSAYIDFFTQYVKDNGISSALDKFVLSPGANVGTTSQHPWMLARFLSGVLHPLIHVGYGAEFNIPGMAVEGLAMTAVTKFPEGLLDHLPLFKEISLQHLAQNASDAIQSVLDSTAAIAEKVLPSALQFDRGDLPSPGPPPPQARTNCLSILSRVLRDAKFAPSEAMKQSDNAFEYTVKTHAQALAAFTDQWDIGESNIDGHIEELVWTVCVLYGVAGWSDGEPFTADFFFMHLVTSSIFLPALCADLPLASQVRLLKAYFHTVLLWSVARGQPVLDVEGFVRATQSPDKNITPPSVKALKDLDLWMRVIEAARSHTDEHVTKTIRSLAAWSAAFGTRSARAAIATYVPAAPKAEKCEAGPGVPKDDEGMGLGTENDMGIARDSGDVRAPLTDKPEIRSDAGEPEKCAAGPGVPQDSEGMGLGTENDMGIARDSGDVRPLPHEEKTVTHSVQADLHPRQWREQKNHSPEPEPPKHTVQADLHPRAWRESKNHGDEDLSQEGYAHHKPPPVDENELVQRSELHGSEYLDGGLFLRIAVLTLGRMGWDKDVVQFQNSNKPVKYGEERDEDFWDFKGFFVKPSGSTKARL